MNGTERTAVDQPSHKDLDGLVITAELTLISITQGVALYFLVSSSYDALAGLDFMWWPYIIVGLFIIFLFWSRALLHTLTIIRWPLEFLHNFMYVASAMIESIMFTQLTHVTRWYVLNLVNGLMVWCTFAFDLRMIHRLKSESGHASDKSFITFVERDQVANVRVILPIVVGFFLLAIILCLVSPDFFIAGSGHVMFIVVQLIFLIGYLMYTLRFYRRLTPLISAYRGKEWMEVHDGLQ